MDVPDANALVLDDQQWLVMYACLSVWPGILVKQVLYIAAPGGAKVTSREGLCNHIGLRVLRVRRRHGLLSKPPRGSIISYVNVLRPSGFTG